MKGQSEIEKRSDNIFTSLWQSLPEAGAEVWKHNMPSENKYNLREALELLCSILWRLELAFELGKLSEESLSNYRANTRKGRDSRGWETWRGQYKGLSVAWNDNELLVKYNFHVSPDDAIRYTLQTTMIADIALRLTGTHEILRCICQEPKPPFLAERKEIKQWLKQKTAYFNKSVTEIQKQVVLMLALRDSYMHGEIPLPEDEKPNDTLVIFRKQRLPCYSPREMFEACQGLWLELCNIFNNELHRLGTSEVTKT